MKPIQECDRIHGRAGSKEYYGERAGNERMKKSYRTQTRPGCERMNEERSDMAGKCTKVNLFKVWFFGVGILY